MKILITGASGQLGSEFKDQINLFPNNNYVFVDKEEMPLDDLGKVKVVLEETFPDIIINCGAYTAVDKAESEPELVDLINHQAVAVMAEWSSIKRKKFIHISTDYVFSGLSSTPLREDELTNPINVYGLSKEKGEHAILRAGGDAIIIRTAWVYSTYGSNFVKTMIRLMADRHEISVIDDQIGSPTYARDLANVILTIIHFGEWQSGIYHFSNEGEISWYEFASAIRDIIGSNCVVNTITTEEYPTLARRPKYSLLDKTKIKQVFGVDVPNWLDSLKTMLIKLDTNN